MRRLVTFWLLIGCMGCEPVTPDPTPDQTSDQKPEDAWVGTLDSGTAEDENTSDSGTAEDENISDSGTAEDENTSDSGTNDDIPSQETPSPLAQLTGTFVGQLHCYEEGASSQGSATLVLQAGEEQATGTITFTGDTPSEFTTTAQLTLWLDGAGALDGAWSDCQIQGGEYAEGNGQLSCHFWHQVQDESGYIFKPNNWTISDDGQTFTIEEEPTVESEAQKCDGALAKQP